METHWLLAMLLLLTGGVDHAATQGFTSDALESSSTLVTTDSPPTTGDGGSTSEALITTEIMVITENSQTTGGTTLVSTTMAQTTQQPDTTAPNVTCPNATSQVTDLNQPTAVVTWNPPEVRDDVDTGLSATCIPPSDSSFKVGSTLVTCFAIDDAENNGTCTFQVNVTDNQVPELTCPEDISENTDENQPIAVVSWDPLNVIDNVDDPSKSSTCIPSSGSSFNVSTTSVTCSATDAAGNTGSCMFLVNVIDNELPVVACPSDITQPTNSGENLATVNWPAPNVTDNVDRNLQATCDPASGGPVETGGPLTVTCEATDTAGNEGSCMFTITVEDREPPMIICPENLSVPAELHDNKGIVVWHDPFVSDNSGYVTLGCDLNVGLYPANVPFTVTCTAADHSRNTAICSFMFQVKDKEPPQLKCPNNTEVATNLGENVATYNVSVTANDNVDGAVHTVCMGQPDYGPENKFGLGDTTVTCTAMDTKNNEGNCSFILTVSDQESPKFDCEDQTFSLLLTKGEAQVNYTIPEATDNVDGVSVPFCSPASGTNFMPGSTLVTCVASDTSNNTGNCTFNVILLDCDPGTFGPTCVNCTCVDNKECVTTSGDCQDCDDKDFGFVCNYMDLAVNITARGLSVLDDVVTQYRGKDVELECNYNLLNIDGNWSRNGTKVMDFEGDNTGTATYTIRNVDFNVTGSTYTCTVNPLKYTDRIGPVFKSVTVNVEVPAEFDTRPENKSGILQDNLTFTCSAKGKPEVKITWIYNNGTSIEPMEKKYAVFESKTEENMIITTNSILVVYNISRSDNGIYKCRVGNTLVNEVDALVDDFEIIVQEKPDPVIINDKESQATAKATEITVKWTRGSERKSKIQNCTVDYKEQGEDMFDSVEAESDESHKLVGLTPYTDYDIEVFCSNNIGRSDKDKVILKTAEAAPTAPGNVQATYVNEDKIENDLCRVTWTAPAELNGVITSYTANYTVAPVGNEGSIEVNRMKNQVGAGVTLDIEANKPNSVYKIKVFGTTIAAGPESEAATCTTAVAGPSKIETPEQPTNPEVNHDSFKITLVEPSARNGSISCYAVIVVQWGASDDVENVDPDREFPDYQLKSYNEAKNKPYVPYIAIAFGEFQKEITIGSGCQSNSRQCTSVPYPHVGINGKLESESTYTVFIRAYVSEGVYSSSPLMEPVKTGSKYNL
ncbi:uncharacterized protein LOC117117004 [Anneissia japonica]|uniref:uncharacterized protein LOC117117004 n=1 Tax=Anneissia japonica TaxID=1529436 RepID=UPI001425AED8|nr:uncharacterized protein LOC117117004 [Anneissia japonica]